MIRDTYPTLQNLQTYYQIGDVDVDRYLIDGKIRQVLIAARGLNSADLPSQSFVNRHIVYTHGYGVVASPSNERRSRRHPNFLLSDVPVNENGIKMDSGPPSQIYFAENLSSYVLTGAEQARVQLPEGGRDRPVHALQGQGRRDAVELRAPRRVRVALRQPRPADLGPDQLRTPSCSWSATSAPGSPSSRRSSQFDADPYPVVLGNRTVWIMDGYTTSDMYPYAPVARRRGFAVVVVQLRAQLGEGHRRRLPGHGHLLRVRQEGPDHPGVRGRVPRPLHRRRRGCPRRSATHLRYPEDLFKSQATMFGRYHVTEPKRFYDGSAKWLVSPDPGSGPVSSDLLSEANAIAADARRRRAATSRRRRRRPARASTRTTSTSDCRTRTDEHFIVTGAVRAGVVGQQPDASGVVPHRELRSRPVRAAARRSRCRRVRPSRARCR